MSTGEIFLAIVACACVTAIIMLAMLIKAYVYIEKKDQEKS